jgi:hypothetical protein
MQKGWWLVPRSEISPLVAKVNDETSMTTPDHVVPTASRRWLLRVVPGAAMAMVVLAGLAACGGEGGEEEGGEEEDDD